MPASNAILGQFGLIGQEVISRLFAADGLNTTPGLLGPVVADSSVRANASLTILATSRLTVSKHGTNHGGGIIGEFGPLGSATLTQWFPNTTSLHAIRARTRQAILGGGATAEPTQSTLSLDWVKDAQPFAWTAANPPNLLTLDWAKDGQPFASNDIALEVLGSGTLSIRADTSTLPSRFAAISGSITLVIDGSTNLTFRVPVPGAATLNIVAGSTLTTPVLVLGGVTLNVMAGSTLGTPEVVSTSVTLSVVADGSLTRPDEITSGALLEIDADSDLTMVLAETGSGTLNIHADGTNDGYGVVPLSKTLDIRATTIVLHGFLTFRASITLSITATDAIASSKRKVKPCELPKGILHITSNLPAGVWQTNPDAIFTWDAVFTCSKAPLGNEMVPGYYWVMDHNPGTVPWYDGHFTKVPNAEIHLNTSDYGSGDWWFHVLAVNWAGLGLVAHYNVRYNLIPTPPGRAGMWIDTLDCLKQTPLVSYRPTTPHQLTWSVSTDLNPNDVLVYELQVGTGPLFGLNPSTGLTEIIIHAESLPSALFNITRTLDPGRYFWRIRAFDGNQPSDWSPTGHFRVNNPPLAPYDLSVSATA